MLVVEDDPAIGAELTEALGVNGYAPTLAVDGRAALRAVEESAPDLVLLDLGLPDLDGVVVCRKLRLAAPEAVIVVLTARTAGTRRGGRPRRGGRRLPDQALPAGRADGPAAGPPAAAGGGRARRARCRSAGCGWTSRRGAPTLDSGRTVAAAQGVRPAGGAGGAAGEVVTREELMDRVWDENWFGSDQDARRPRVRAAGSLEEPGG